MSDVFDALYDDLQGQPCESSPAHWNRLAARGQALVDAARQLDDANAANRAWHLTLVATARSKMSELFIMMRESQFQSAWSVLEQVEKMVEALERNAILEDSFAIRQLGMMVANWQALYPYNVFASPEMITRRQECTVCNAVVSPMQSCGHLPGFIYAGVICSRRIKEAEAVSIAIVRDPVQKYSVLIPDPDPHDYSRLRFVLDRLAGPFSRWRIVQTTFLHNHSHFQGWSADGNCPCHSGFSYAACCAPKAGVSLPHDQILFEEPPPATLPQFLLRRRAHADGDLEDVPISTQVA